MKKFPVEEMMLGWVKSFPKDIFFHLINVNKFMSGEINIKQLEHETAKLIFSDKLCRREYFPNISDIPRFSHYSKTDDQTIRIIDHLRDSAVAKRSFCIHIKKDVLKIIPDLELENDIDECIVHLNKYLDKIKRVQMGEVE